MNCWQVAAKYRLLLTQVWLCVRHIQPHLFLLWSMLSTRFSRYMYIINFDLKILGVLGCKNSAGNTLLWKFQLRPEILDMLRQLRCCKRAWQSLYNIQNVTISSVILLCVNVRVFYYFTLYEIMYQIVQKLIVKFCISQLYGINALTL